MCPGASCLGVNVRVVRIRGVYVHGGFDLQTQKYMVALGISLYFI